jgi:flagellar hook-length control protein FliK
MRISEQNVNSVNSTNASSERRADDQKTSDRFSQLLKSKDEKKNGNENGGIGNKKDGQDAHQKSSATTTDSTLIAPLAADSSMPRLPQPSASGESAKIAQPSTSATPQIEGLSTELAHQIDVVKKDGVTEGVNITFDSKALEGLQVQIRQENGEMSIRFVTQSDTVSKLLSRNVGELKESLANKGVKVQNISISNAQTSPALRGYRNAGN